MLVLSLFPGIGLLDMAFELEGFCVVRGPDLLWGGDIREFHPPAGRFDGIIGGPPCQAFSRLRHMVLAQGHTPAANLIPEYERVVTEVAPSWFVMENVPDAPLPIVAGYPVCGQLVKDTWVGGETSRCRRFSFGGLPLLDRVALMSDGPLLTAPNPPPAVLAAGNGRARPVRLGGSGKPNGRARGLAGGGFPPPDRSDGGLREMLRLQGLPRDWLDGAPFTASGKTRAIGNGVPLPMGRAVARAVKRALGLDTLPRAQARTE